MRDCWCSVDDQTAVLHLSGGRVLTWCGGQLAPGVTDPLPQSNSTLMLSRRSIRRMASPNSGATETTSILDESLEA